MVLEKSIIATQSEQVILIINNFGINDIVLRSNKHGFVIKDKRQKRTFSWIIDAFYVEEEIICYISRGFQAENYKPFLYEWFLSNYRYLYSFIT